MPYINYFLTTEVKISKDSLKAAIKPLLTPDLNLGSRQWNKKQLEALSLILCNIVKLGHLDHGKFLYSRKKEGIPVEFNPNKIGYRSFFWVIEALVSARLISGKIAASRVKGGKAPKKLSEFHVTPQVITFAESLGITQESVIEIKKGHVRLRHVNTDQPLSFEHDGYTRHIENLMIAYCAYLNQQNILLSTEDYEHKGFNNYGLLGERLHLYRNYRDYASESKLKKEMEKLFIETNNPNFSFGGRSGAFWQSAKREDRSFILINGKKTERVDFPCSHLNLCYKTETGKWYQSHTYNELKRLKRTEDDGYYLPNIKRDVVKAMVTRMFNVKSKAAASKVFNDWLKKEHNTGNTEDKKKIADYLKKGYSNVELMNLILKKHNRISHYFLKGKLGGQIIQWAEAHRMHQIAIHLIEKYDVPTLTVYDELIVPKSKKEIAREVMYIMKDDAIYKKYSLMNQIKNLG